MKQTLKKWLLPLLLLGSLQMNAQEVQKGNPGMWPQSIHFKTAAPVFQKNAPLLTDGAGTTAALSSARLLKTEKDAAGMEHYRYQQRHNGIPVEHAAWVVHVSNGKINSENGKLVKDFPSGLAKTAAIAESSALTLAKNHIGASQYKWEVPEEEALLQQMTPGATYLPKGELVYYSGDLDVIPTALRLAWKFDIYAHLPMSRQVVFVDAVDGKILGKRSLIHETNAPGTAVTGYSGTQPIMADFTGATYRLRETGRGNGINTYNMKNAGTNYGAAVDFTDADNNWNNVNANLDQYATDAHWGTEKTYDYFFTRFNRNSIDNAGFALNSYVHTNLTAFGYPNNVNAFWDGAKMTYGDGSAAYSPLTTLDITGHEITHGLTQFTSNLVYSYESGALNEAFSDIFGAAIEFYARPGSANWTLGEDIGLIIRNMSNPNQFSDPDTYQGTYWYTGSSDNGGVHTNSGVLNFWFYLLSAGGTGTNDHGYNYAVTGIGINDAAAIAYRLNTFYLYSTADYYTARTLGVQAAEDLFGPGSPQAIQTANAFAAVGLYAPTCNQASGLAVVSLQDMSATLTWNSSPGALSYTTQFRTVGSTTWYNAGTGVDTFANLGNLATNTAYEWRVRSSCNSTFTYGQFTTLSPICRPPTGLLFIVNGTGVNLSWNPVNFALRYLIEYKALADNVWTSIPSTTTTAASLTGLANATTYEWRVRTGCAPDSSDWAFSQFTTDVPVCAAPTGLTTTHTAGLVTTMRWNAVPGALGYRLQLALPGSNFSSPDEDFVLTDTSYTLTGLMSGFILQWRVAPNCANNYGNWSASQFLTPCPAPASISATNITPTSATLSWAATTANSNYGYTLQYKLSTSGTWLTYITTFNTSSTPTNLQQGKTYDWRVRQNCININSAYAQVQFTTPCTNAPVNLNYSKVTPNSVFLTWGAVAGTTGYTLQYRLGTSTTWTSVSGITTNSYTLGGLAAGANYKIRVQANCTVGGPGAFGNEISINTYCNSSGVNSQEWIDYVKLGNTERYSGADAGGYFNSATTYTPFSHTLGSTVAGIISAGFSSTVRNQYYAVYVDLNRNGSFADAGERVVNQTAMINSGLYGFNITIPATATPGVTAVRFVMLRQPTAVQPCLTGSRGETEDFYVNLVAPAAFGFAPAETVTVINRAESGFMVSPNPSTGIFRVSLPQEFAAARYEVMNAAGTVVKRATIQQPGFLNIDMSGAPAGLYLLRLSDGSGKQEVLKLVKQ